MYRENVSILFAYLTDIRTTICTTNAIESLNSVICHATKNRNFFFKMIRLEGHSFSYKTNICNMDNVHSKLKSAMNRFIVGYGNRINCHF